jgi:hypothetical protein
MDLRCSRNSLPVHGSGKLRNSRPHLGVQHQPLLTGSDVGGHGHNETRRLDRELLYTSEALLTTFKDDALEVIVILNWMKRACVKFRKFAIMIVQEM